MALTILNAVREIIDRDRSGALTGKMSEYFRYFMNNVFQKLENTEEGSTTLADDAEISLEKEAAGYGFCQIGDNQEYALFSFTTAGVVTLISNSANVANTDSDTDLCIYDAGTKVNIKNRLGSSLKLRYSVKYNPL